MLWVESASVPVDGEDQPAVIVSCVLYIKMCNLGYIVSFGISRFW